MASAGNPARFDVRRRFMERLRSEFATREDTAAVERALGGVRDAVDALAERLDRLEERVPTQDDVADVRREIAVVRTGLRAVTNTVSAIDEDGAAGS